MPDGGVAPVQGGASDSGKGMPPYPGSRTGGQGGEWTCIARSALGQQARISSTSNTTYPQSRPTEQTSVQALLL